MLAETRAELDDFHQASKELEAELQNELQRTERAQREVQVKVIRAENERDEWKVHVAPESTRCQFTYLTLFFRISSCPFKQHNTTTTSPQRELDQLRQELEYQKTKENIRELEMGNDDWSATNTQSLPVWLIWSPTCTQGYWRKRFCWVRLQEIWIWIIGRRGYQRPVVGWERRRCITTYVQ
jgi:hypothetical protein